MHYNEAKGTLAEEQSGSRKGSGGGATEGDTHGYSAPAETIRILVLQRRHAML